MQLLRLLAVGLFIFLGLLASVALLSPWFDHRRPSPLLILPLIAIFIVLVVSAIAIFGPRLKASDATRDEIVEQLEAAGLLISENFTARRAFQVEEFEDEGSHYFIELTDGRVLYLNGQYLYDYEVGWNDESDQRRFPCSNFIVRRHRDERYVADIICRGHILQPELNAPPFSSEDHDRGNVPEDGEILRIPYEQIKAARIRSRL